MSRLDADDVRIDWHRNWGNEQLVLALDGGRVKVVVAFPTEASRDELEAVLAERDRELEHYFAAATGRRDASR